MGCSLWGRTESGTTERLGVVFLLPLSLKAIQFAAVVFNKEG